MICRESESGNRNKTRDWARGLGSILLKVEVFLPPLLSSLVFSIYKILWTLSLRPLHWSRRHRLFKLLRLLRLFKLLKLLRLLRYSSCSGCLSCLGYSGCSGEPGEPRVISAWVEAASLLTDLGTKKKKSCVQLPEELSTRNHTRLYTLGCYLTNWLTSHRPSHNLNNHRDHLYYNSTRN
jgi:hypothetical protein